MNDKIAAKTIAIIVISLGIVTATTNAVLVKAYFPVEFYPGENFSWKIDEVSSGNNEWYNSTDWSKQSNWFAEVNDDVSFTVTNYQEIQLQNYLIGELEIGNLSLTTNNYDIGFNLLLSINPWYGGLVCIETDWDELKSSSPFTNENASMNFFKINALGVDVEAVKINYNDSMQISQFIYEKYTGIMIQANTTFLSFNLALHLTSSSIPLPSPSETLSFPEIISFLGAVIIITLVKKLKQAK
ncbi:MAG: hypothetical protein ACFFDW_00280 [Candidatus Thorarchaeota archaeon]